MLCHTWNWTVYCLLHDEHYSRIRILSIHYPNALGILNTILTADTGAIAPSNELGGLFGMLQSAESAAGMIGPFLGGMVSHSFAEYYGMSAPLMVLLGFICGCFSLCFGGMIGLFCLVLEEYHRVNVIVLNQNLRRQCK